MLFAQMFKYLYSYPSNIFNGDTPVFELESLKGSQVKKAIVFAGKPAPPLHAMQALSATSISK